MAKRTPRSQADDATASPPPPAPAKPRAPRRTPARAAAGTAAATQSTDTAEPSDDMTYAGRPEANEQAVADASVPENRSVSMASEPNEEDIRLRAYERYLERGGSHGMDFEDWVEAERELRQRRSDS